MCRYALGMGNPGDHSLLSCPRCGYDLTPMVPTPGPARDAVGKCSECGLGFTWNGLFDALRQLLPRFVEHSKGFRATAIAIFWTLAWLILPHRFWRRITVERKVRLPRAVLWLVVLIPLTRLSETLAIFLANAWASWLPHIADVSMIPTMAELWYDLSEVFTARANSGYYDQGEPPLAIIATLLSLFAALMFLILPQTRRQAKVRTALVVRCWVYSHALLAALYMWNLVSITYAGIVPYSGWQRWGFSPWEQIIDALNDASDFRSDAFLLLGSAMVAWQGWYWYTALRSLRIPSAGWVAGSMVLAAMLATTLILLLSGAFPIDSII